MVFGFVSRQQLKHVRGPAGKPAMPRKIPSTIFSYWDSGLSDAPPLVRLCVKSWVSNSGAEKIVVLDDASLYDYLAPADLPRTFSELPPQKRANAIRLALLNRHGGIWLDASIFVRSPLFEWVDEVASPSGLFVFRDPGPDRFFSNWFIASAEGHSLIREIQRDYLRFFEKERVHNFHIRPGELSMIVWTLFQFFQKTLFSKSKFFSQLWAVFPLNKLKFYPYFIFHYIANRVLKRRKCRDSFVGMDYVPARLGLVVRHRLRKEPDILDFDDLLTGNRVPLQKLSSHTLISSTAIASLNGQR